MSSHTRPRWLLVCLTLQAEDARRLQTLQMPKPAKKWQKRLVAKAHWTLVVRALRRVERSDLQMSLLSTSSLRVSWKDIHPWSKSLPWQSYDPAIIANLQIHLHETRLTFSIIVRIRAAPYYWDLDPALISVWPGSCDDTLVLGYACNIQSLVVSARSSFVDKRNINSRSRDDREFWSQFRWLSIYTPFVISQQYHSCLPAAFHCS